MARTRPSTRSHSSRSVFTSSALDRSSITRSCAPCASMRAAATRCAWPPERRSPRAPTRVRSPSAMAARSGSSTASRTAAASAASASGAPSEMLSCTVVLNSLGVCGV